MNRPDFVNLRERWDSLMTSLDVDAALAEGAFIDLTARYGEDGRYYHTITHIQNVLDVIESLRHLAGDWPAIQLAAWFHDIIYEIGETDNEEQSARYAEKALGRLGIPTETITAVVRLIHATKTHQADLDDIDCQILLDADLASFGSDWEQQELIAQAIRQEYAVVPEKTYHNARRQLLNQFLRRDRIYLTQPMFTAYEERARQNIIRAIEALD